MKKEKIKIKNNEKKSLEEIISSNNYYDLSKKHNRRKNSLDTNTLYSEVVKTQNINLGKKINSSTVLDKNSKGVLQINSMIDNIDNNDIFLNTENNNNNMKDMDNLDKSFG